MKNRKVIRIRRIKLIAFLASLLSSVIIFSIGFSTWSFTFDGGEVSGGSFESYSVAEFNVGEIYNFDFVYENGNITNFLNYNEQEKIDTSGFNKANPINNLAKIIIRLDVSSMSKGETLDLLLNVSLGSKTNNQGAKAFLDKFYTIGQSYTSDTPSLTLKQTPSASDVNIPQAVVYEDDGSLSIPITITANAEISNTSELPVYATLVFRLVDGSGQTVTIPANALLNKDFSFKIKAPESAEEAGG